jgi:hypothetical protein
VLRAAFSARSASRLVDLYRALRDPATPPALRLWLMRSDADEVRLAEQARARGQSGPMLDFKLGQAALASGAWPEAEERFARAEAADPQASIPNDYRVLSACLRGDADRARTIARFAGDGSPVRRLLQEACGS